MKKNFVKIAILLIIICLGLTFNLSTLAKPDNAAASLLDEQALDTDLATNQRVLPIVMYHQILKHSQKSAYIIKPSTFENDLKELLFRGYTTVFPSQLIDFVEGKTDLPQKPILITFDDGHYNNVYYGQPLLQKYDCKALINVIGKFSDNTTKSGDHSKPAYSHLTWQQIKQINDGKTFEIGNHTYNMHNFKPRYGIAPKSGESNAAYTKALRDDLTQLQDKLKEYGVQAQCFAYPFGKLNRQAQKVIVEMGFKMTFNCTEKRNTITQNQPSSLYGLCRFNRSPSYSSAQFFDKIEKTKR